MLNLLCLDKAVHWLSRKLFARQKSPHQQQVEAAMVIAQQEMYSVPTEPSQAGLRLRARLIMEEAMEAIHGLGVQVSMCGDASLAMGEGEAFTLPLNGQWPARFQTSDGHNLKYVDADPSGDDRWTDGDMVFEPDSRGWPIDSEGKRLDGQMIEVRKWMGEFGFAVTHETDLVEVADGCLDLNVVSTGTLSTCGIADEVLQNEVNENNLRKFVKGFKLDAGGKYQKPPGHKPPRVKEILEAQALVAPVEPFDSSKVGK